MNILLVNLTRFGDLLQSQAAVNALSTADLPVHGAGPGVGPGSEPFSSGKVPPLANSSSESPAANRVGLVCLANFAFTGAFLKNVSATFPLPKDGFLAKLLSPANEEPSGSGGAAACGRWAQAAAGLWQWRAEIWRGFKPDLVCNLTPSLPARLLAAYLADGVPLTGFGLDELGFSKDSPWAAYLQGASQQRELSPFNVSDVFRAVAGRSFGRAGDALLKPRPQEDIDRLALRMREELERACAGSGSRAEECRGFVAFQPGASSASRRWPLEYFAWVGRALWREFKLVPVLLGSKGELELAERYAGLSAGAAGAAGAAESGMPEGPPPHISLVGATGLEELAAALSNCKLLISNDTGTMHLAAGLGVPVLGIFLATAQPWDTGPTLAGSCVLEPELDCHPCAFGQECAYELRCRYSVRPELVYDLTRAFLRRGGWKSEPEQPALSGRGARIWLTETDASGCLHLRSLSGHELEPRTQWFNLQRDFLRQFLDRDQNGEFVLKHGGTEFYLPAEQREKLSAELEYFAARLQSLLEQGKLLELRPLPRFRELFLQSVAQLTGSFKNSRFFGAVGFLWRIEVHGQGGDLAGAMHCIAAYKRLIDGLSLRLRSAEQ